MGKAIHFIGFHAPSKLIQMQLATLMSAQQVARYQEKTQNITEEMY